MGGEGKQGGNAYGKEMKREEKNNFVNAHGLGKEKKKTKSLKLFYIWYLLRNLSHICLGELVM